MAFLSAGLSARSRATRGGAGEPARYACTHKDAKQLERDLPFKLTPMYQVGACERAQQAVGRAKNCSLRKEQLIKANTIKQLEKSETYQHKVGLAQQELQQLNVFKISYIAIIESDVKP